MKASELKKQIDQCLNEAGEKDFEVVIKCDGWVYDINIARLGNEENGRENHESEPNVIILRASQ